MKMQSRRVASLVRSRSSRTRSAASFLIVGAITVALATAALAAVSLRSNQTVVSGFKAVTATVANVLIAGLLQKDDVAGVPR